MSSKSTQAFDPGHTTELTPSDELNLLITRLAKLSNEMASYYEDNEHEGAETLMSAVESIIEYKWDKDPDGADNLPDID